MKTLQNNGDNIVNNRLLRDFVYGDEQAKIRIGIANSKKSGKVEKLKQYQITK